MPFVIAETATIRISLGDCMWQQFDNAVAIYRTAVEAEWSGYLDNDVLIFPSDYHQLLLRICAFLKATFLDSKPQTSVHYGHRKHVSRKTMNHRRQNLGYGISNVFRPRREDVPHPDRLYHETRLLINKLYEDSGKSGASGYEKKYLGIDDFKLVIQAGIALHGERPKDFAYSLTMVTGMLLARSVAARPGAIYATTYKENGQTKIRWPGLDNKQHANSTGNDTNKMRVRLRSPRAILDLPFSVSYQLLAMAISDGVLADAVTVDDALDATGTIYAHPRYKHTPVFHRPGTDGTRSAVIASDA
ncbi:hypothetical protein LTR17_026109 [Elasticomyces elasticus]|nr:hypothetical protein LTR17_026109 [Elasticomyces elasticus]